MHVKIEVDGLPVFDRDHADIINACPVRQFIYLPQFDILELTGEVGSGYFHFPANRLFQTILEDVNVFFSINLNIEMLKAIPRGEGIYLFRLYKEN